MPASHLLQMVAEVVELQNQILGFPSHFNPFLNSFTILLSSLQQTSKSKTSKHYHTPTRTIPMEPFVPFARTIPVLSLAFLVAVFPVWGQINSPCNPSMIARFTPCMNLLTNSTANGTSPTANCCDYLRSLTSGGMDCLCLIVTASVPFQLPINRSLAISLPRACNMPGVPVQCRASAAPIPAPGPIPLGPALSPEASPSSTPPASGIPQPAVPAQSPEADTTQFLTPPSTVRGAETPTSTTNDGTGISPELTPSSAAIPSYSFLTYLLVLALSCVVLKLY